MRMGWPEHLAFSLPVQKLGYKPLGIGTAWGGPKPKKPKRPALERFLANVDITPGCWNWHGPVNETGYGRFFLDGKNRKAPRVAYELMVGPIPPSDYSVHGTMILHTCDNPKCVNPLHLRLGTALDNMADAKAKGRLRGNKKSKLNEEAIRDIRARIAAGENRKEIAMRYGVHPSHINHIEHGKCWKWVA
jgi:hypothetical protein